MSLLRDGVHRRAPYTARFGAARFGTARFGCCYGQNDLAMLTREIKDNNLVGIGPKYVWTERYRTAAPFGGIQAFSFVGSIAMQSAIGSTTASHGLTFKGQFTLASPITFAMAKFGNIGGQSTVEASIVFTDV